MRHATILPLLLAAACVASPAERHAVFQRVLDDGGNVEEPQDTRDVVVIGAVEEADDDRDPLIRLTAVPLLALLAACEVPDPNDVGDTHADTASPTDTGDDACRRPEDCADDQVCVSDGTCASAYGRVYAVGLSVARIHPTKPSDAAWDPLGGAPDPKWTLFLNGRELGGGEVQEDTISADWDDGWRIVVDETSSFRFVVEDDDLNFDDPIAELVFSPPSVDVLRNGGAGIEVDDSDFGVDFILDE